MTLHIKWPALFFAVFYAAQTLSDSHDKGFDNITLKTTHVRGNIYMLEGVGGFAGGNIGVSSGEDGVLLIDDLLGPMSEKITAAVTAINATKPRFILNTHWHGDHTGNNAHFSKHATIISHSNVRKRLMADQENFFGKSPAQAKEAWPLITFDQSLSVHFNGEDIQFTHYSNGHTDGDGVIYFPKNNVAHLGDHFFTESFPFIDLATGGNAFNLTDNIKTIIAALPEDALIIPGHGALSDMNGLRLYYRMLENTTAQVQAAAAEGESLEDIQLQGLSSDWTGWGGGFVNEALWIEFIYRSLPAKK